MHDDAAAHTLSCQHTTRAHLLYLHMAMAAVAAQVIDESTMNACCLPGGKMIVYRGILEQIESDDTLAFLMGHEMAHAICRHSVSEPPGAISGCPGLGAAARASQALAMRRDE
jgi:Zn-dependent protease with chaperone function